MKTLFLVKEQAPVLEIWLLSTSMYLNSFIFQDFQCRQSSPQCLFGSIKLTVKKHSWNKIPSSYKWLQISHLLESRLDNFYPHANGLYTFSHFLILLKSSMSCLICPPCNSLCWLMWSVGKQSLSMARLTSVYLCLVFFQTKRIFSDILLPITPTLPFRYFKIICFLDKSV